MVIETAERLIKQALKECGLSDVTDVIVNYTDPRFGDVSTNVALAGSSHTQLAPRELAVKLVEYIISSNSDTVKSAEIAGPGFINITFTDEYLWSSVREQIEKLPTPYKGQKVVSEYSDPNAFKALHAGHLYTTIVGNTVSNLVEAAGGEVHRVNFGGDVGLHVAKAMWGIISEASAGLDEQIAFAHIEKLDKELALAKKAEFLAAHYVVGSKAYEAGDSTDVIVEYNKRIYALHKDGDKDSAFARIYWLCRSWSYEYFDYFYKELKVKPFEKYYPESQTAPLGLKVVNENTGSVYEKNKDAVIFKGEDYGLHTRVFVNSEGLPTYEAKDVGLSLMKWQDYSFDTSIIITSVEIKDYMRVVLKSIEQFEPKLAKRTKHLTHGNVKLQGGQKMSSRTGNVLLAKDVLGAAKKAAAAASGEQGSDYSLDAVKYSFLNQRIGSDIIYSPELSVAVTGNSGPYLQYAHARASSVISKVQVPSELEVTAFEDEERLLVRKISEYSTVFNNAVTELAPHVLCGYLHELVQVFNRFYDTNRVLKDPRAEIRGTIIQSFKNTLEHGLNILGIQAPERM